MNGVIVYKSKYGSTAEYAEWLREETGFEVFDTKQCPKDLNSYDTVVIGSYIRAGRLVLAGWIRSHWPILEQKTVLLMLVNVTTDQEAQAKIVPQSLPAEIVSHMRVFPVSGRYLPSEMSSVDRMLIKVVASMTKDPKVKQELLGDRDMVNKDNLKDLLGYIMDLQSLNSR